VVFALFALLIIDSAYLSAISVMEWFTGGVYQNYLYQYTFLGHLVLGLLFIVPVVVYGIIHISNAHDRPNRRAVKVGYVLFVTAIVLLISGVVLTRGIPVVEIRDPTGREIAYWAHVITPLVVAWLFVLHRLAGKRINWRFGGAVAGLAALLIVPLLILQMQDPRQWNVAGPESGEQYFFPSLSRTSTGDFIPAQTMMMDEYCKECHEDIHESWSSSVHRLASFNNPAYLFAVRNTRQAVMDRDGSVQAARFCAGCHDLVPFFSGAFDDPDFDDINHPTAQSGITCTGCHAITNVNSVKGNADYTIEEPLHYPFAFSDDETLQWLNRFLVKAKPEFHKKTFLKPLHQTTEFCGTCHKVHLPEELNHYKWLRGQNHYDAFLLSGVSGHGITSFYYPAEAEPNCNNCHMPLFASEDFGAKSFDDSGELKVHDHLFPSANAAVPALLGHPESVTEAHQEFIQDALRVDIFGIRQGGTIEGEQFAPLRPDAPQLEAGQSYLLDVVLRTMTMGHLFTQGTADSNEVWLELELLNNGRVIGRSGGQAEDGDVDPWSHFVNAYVIDRDGNRIDRRNAEDIFTILYNNQIPPGAADVVHYAFTVPEDAQGTVEVIARLNYRKFDTLYTRLFQGDDFAGNDLPVLIIAEDRIEFPLGADTVAPAAVSDIPEWQRWNDYGIGLLRKRGLGELRQAEAAFERVAELERAEGPLNLARVYIREGRLGDAVSALNAAARHDPPAYPWSVSYFTGLVNKQNGYLDEALESFRSVIDTQFQEAQDRNFDFSRDYRLLNEYAGTLFERAKLERGDARKTERDRYLAEAVTWFQRALVQDPENATAHYGLAQAYTQLGQDAEAETHRRLHARYKQDDNARDRAIAMARKKSAPADHASDAVVIYDLQRPGTYGLWDGELVVQQ